MDNAWEEMLRVDFPDYTDEQIHHLIDTIEEQMADAVMYIYQDVVRQAKFEETLTDK